MKKRIGFVSNSSSSSFIIAVKDEKVSTKITIEYDLTDLESERFNTYQEYLEHCAEYHDSVEDFLKESKDCNHTQTILAKAKKAFDEGKILIKGEVSSEDEDSISCYLYTEENIRSVMTKDTQFEVIQDTNEY